MKTLKQLKEEYDGKLLSQVVTSDDEIMLEVTQSKSKTISSGPSYKQMPAMLLFRRITYRQYPGGQTVALYYSALVDKYLSIPFGPTGNLNLSEAVIHDELPLNEETDAADETGMAKTQLKAISSKANNLDSKLKSAKNLPAWVQSKIAVAKDGITAVDDYMTHGNEKLDETEAWQRKEGQSPEGGLNRKGIMAYRRANPGSKLSMAVTTKPSKLKKGSKAANRRKSFCARMGGMKKRLTSAKTARDPDSRINKALRKWNCEEDFNLRLQELRQQRVDEGWRETISNIGKSMPGYGDKEASKVAWKKGDYLGAAGHQAKALGKAALTGLGVAATGLAARSLVGGAAAGAATSAALDAAKNSSKPAGGGDSSLYKEPISTAWKSQPKIKSYSATPRSSVDPVAQSKIRAGEIAQAKQTSQQKVQENKMSDIRKMIKEGIEYKNLNINGRTVTLNTSMAKRILEVYDSVNTRNKKIVEGMLNEDMESFKKLLNFSIKA